MIPPLHWNEHAGRVDMLDQTKLPVEEDWLEITTPEEMAAAIRRLSVRGAPAIGIAAAYGAVLAVDVDQPAEVARAGALSAIEMLAGTRPTAVNLFWALERMRSVVHNNPLEAGPLRAAMLFEAKQIEHEDREAGLMLGEYGLALLDPGMTVMTHCHTGGVATSGYGTALAPLVLSRERGVALQALVGETRPLLQGSRITAWELQKAGVPATVITDSMAGHAMREGRVNAVFVGADRIAANGDVANKIGTYGLAVLAQAHNVPFYVSAPCSTIDMDVPNGGSIEIEQRESSEITHGFGRQTAPNGINVYNPAFDVTPAELVTALVTEKGVVRAPYPESIAALFAQ